MARALIILALVAFASAAPQSVQNPEHAGFFEGDMRLPEGLDIRHMRNGIIGNNYRWPGGVVPIQIDSGFTSAERNVIQQGLDDISSKTCIRFVTRSNEANYVFMQRGGANSGCWSYVGRIGGRQILNLQAGNPGCVFKGIVAHEMIHAIGFFHAQSRTDRDNYVTINWSNIQSGTEGNFEKYTSGQVSDQGVSYDYGSLMHYGAYDFAINPNVPTIIVPNGVSIGQRNGVSDKDAQQIRNMYSC